jgi:hypothetical protein
MDHTQRLRNCHPSFLLGQSIQSHQHGLNLTLSQQLFGELLYGTLSDRKYRVNVTEHLLNRPCFICFVAKASTESNSTNILTIIFVIMGVGGIAV